MINLQEDIKNLIEEDGETNIVIRIVEDGTKVELWNEEGKYFGRKLISNGHPIYCHFLSFGTTHTGGDQYNIDFESANEMPTLLEIKQAVSKGLLGKYNEETRDEIVEKCQFWIMNLSTLIK